MASWPPKKNSVFTVTFPVYDNDGDLVSAAADLDTEVSIDGGTFTDCTNEATELATSSGIYKLNLEAAEMNGDIITTLTKTSTGNAKSAVNVMYTATRQIDDIFYDPSGYIDASVASRSSHGDPDPSGYIDVSIASRSSHAAADTADAVWDEDVVAAHNTADTAGYLIDDIGTKADFKADVTNLDAAVSSRSSHAAADVWSVATRNLTALGFALANTDFAAGSIDANALAADAANEIADAILKRDMDAVEATAALHSLATAILKAVSKIEDDAGTLKVYRTDGITLHMSQTVGTDASLDPVDSLTAGV